MDDRTAPENDPGSVPGPPDTPDGDPPGAETPTETRFWFDDTDPVGFPPVPPLDHQPAADPGAPGTGASPGPLGRPRRRRVLAIVAAVLALGLLSAGIVLAGTRGGHRTAGQASGPHPVRPPEATPDSGNPLTGPRQGRRSATFALADGTSGIRVHAADLGDDLYRVSVPAGSGLSPRARQQDGEVTLFVAHGDGAGGVVDVALNSGVRWSLNIVGGTDDSVIDMTGGDVGNVELAGGSSRIDVTMPRPAGPVTVRMTGGVRQFAVHLAASTPVRVQVLAGAGRVTIGRTTHNGIAPGQSFTAGGWRDGAAGVDVQAVAGMASLSVSPTS